MKRPISIALALSLTASLGALTPATAEEPAGDAKSAILLIGDGMSLAQVYSTQIFAEEVLGESLVLPDIADSTPLATFPCCRSGAEVIAMPRPPSHPRRPR